MSAHILSGLRRRPSLSIWKKPVAALLLASVLGASHAQSEAYLAETRLFAMSYCPAGWVMVAGQQMALQQNEALYTLVGTAYGGDGVQTFGVPDLRGRSPIGQGASPGQLGGGVVGQRAGAEEVVLNISQIPAHTHQHRASTAPATHATPAPGRMLAQAQNGGLYAADGGPIQVASVTSSSGSNVPVPVRDPFLAMSWCMAVTGLYPSRP